MRTTCTMWPSEPSSKVALLSTTPTWQWRDTYDEYLSVAAVLGGGGDSWRR